MVLTLPLQTSFDASDSDFQDDDALTPANAPLSARSTHSNASPASGKVPPIPVPVHLPHIPIPHAGFLLAVLLLFNPRPPPRSASSPDTYSRSRLAAHSLRLGPLASFAGAVLSNGLAPRLSTR